MVRTRSPRSALAAAWAPSLRLGTAIVPAFTRGAPTIAQSAAALADAAPGRVALGIGTSSNVIVEKWNGIPFDRPYERVRDVVRFLRVALTGQKVTQTYDTFTVDGFRLLLVPEIQPKLLIAALRPGMLQARRQGGRWRHHQLARCRRCAEGHPVRAPGWTGQGDRGPHLRLPDR